MKRSFLILSVLFAGYSFAIEDLPVKKVMVFKDKTILYSELNTYVNGRKNIDINLPAKGNSIILVDPAVCSIPYYVERKKNELSEYRQLEKRLKDLKQKVDAKKIKLDLLKKVNLGLENLDQAEEKALTVLKEIDRLNKEIKDIEKKLKNFNPISVNVNCPAGNYAKVFFFTNVNPSVFSASTYYIVKADTKAKSVDLNIRSKIKSNIKLDNFILEYYGYKTSEVPVFRILPLSKRLKAESITSVEEKTTKFVFKTNKPISVKPNEPKDVLLFKKVFKNVNFKVFIKGNMPKNPQLVAWLKSDTFIYPSDNAKYFVDDTFVKEGQFKGLKPNKVEKINFGRDEKTLVQKKLIKNLIDRRFIGKDRQVVLYQYRIRNNHKNSMVFYLVEHIPPYRDEKYLVKLISPDLKPKSYNPYTGLVEYEFKIAGNSEIKFRFGYEKEIKGRR